jgi:hypothetical protein
MKAAYYGAFAAVVAIASLTQAQSAKKQVGDREKLIGACSARPDEHWSVTWEHY